MTDSPDKKKIDHKYTDQIVCPYCGNEHTDSWEFKEDSSEIQCGECEQSFTYERQVTVEYCTSKIKPKPESATP